VVGGRVTNPVGFSSAWPVPQDVTNVWTAFGHSFIQHTTGTFDQNGRIDALFRSALRIENSNWANYAISGARLTSGSMWNGGWLNLFYNTQRRPTKVWPYVPQGGGMLMVTGINDLGNLSNTTQTRTAWEHGNRACISRWRASAVRFNTDSSIVYGAGFTSVTGQEERSTTGTLRQATTVGGTATITITLPSTYKGEPIVICFIGRSGTVGGDVTFSGSAGVTGTLSTSNILPSAVAEYCPVVKRITNLTSANASQTIVATTSRMDASGNVLFDSYWIESLTPQPVIVANMNKLTTAAHNAYYTSTWTGNQAAREADVDAWNLTLTDLVRNEFDSMVQVADFDRALNKDPDLMSPTDNQLHPNEHGAAKCVDALMQAVLRLKPVPSRVAKFGTAAHFHPTASSGSAYRLPQGRVGWWYAPEYRQIAGTGLLSVSGDVYAVPFLITEPDTRWDLVGYEVQTAATVASTWRFGLYADLRWVGYPQHLITEWGSGLTSGTTTGWKTQSLTWEPDPGLYWFTLKCTSSAATAATLRLMDGPNRIMPALTTTAPPATGTTYPMAWRLTGQGTGAQPTRFPTTATVAVNAPLIAIRRAAAA
jgi:hypothetical protein